MKSKGTSNEPIILFYSYSHLDENYRKSLENHLATLQQAGLIIEWHDRKILPADEWDKEIDENLENADVILILISSNFFASAYCNKEAKRALEKHKQKESLLIPVILSPVVWEKTPYYKLQALPKDARPVVIWKQKDKAYKDICQGILKLIHSIKSEKDYTNTSSSESEKEPDYEGFEKTFHRKVLDAAVPEEATVYKAMALIAMIRAEDSDGLKKILRINTQYGVNEDDVISTKTFSLEFPVNENGEPQPLDLHIKIESPDFKPSKQIESVSISPAHDSEPQYFLLTPKMTGDLYINLKLYNGKSLISSCLLKTNVSEKKTLTKKANLVTNPISINGNTTYIGNVEKVGIEHKDLRKGNEGAVHQSQNKMLTGLFRDRESAEIAFNLMCERGYTYDDITVLMSDDTRNRYYSGRDAEDTELGSKALEGAGAGSAIGGTLGAIIGGVAAIGSSVILPGSGLIVAGPLAATLAGAGAGRLTDGLVGALIGSGLPEERAKLYEEGVIEGGMVFGVIPRTTEDAEYLENEWSRFHGEHIYR